MFVGVVVGDVLHMVMYVHTDDSAKWGEKSNNDFQFVTFINRFLSDGAAGMAVKGLVFSHKY